MDRQIALLVVLLHALISIMHGLAHWALGVSLDWVQSLYVGVMVTAAPLIAGWWIYTRRLRAGYLLLAISMAGSLVFGVYYHYIGISPDHVSHLPPGDAQGAFRSSAIWLAVIEGAGVVVGGWGVWRTSRR